METKSLQLFARHCGVDLKAEDEQRVSPPPPLVLILWDVSMAHVCECQ